jgi:hypothetical protein
VRVMIAQIQNINQNSPPMQEACIVTLHTLCANVLANPGRGGLLRITPGGCQIGLRGPYWRSSLEPGF